MELACLRIGSPAKVNFGLRIMGKRPDGYHTIQTILQTLDLCDWLTFRICDQLAQIFGRKARIGQNRLWSGHRNRHRFEVGGADTGMFVQCLIDRQLRRGDKNGVTVRRRRRDGLGSDVSSCAATIFYDEVRAKLCRKLVHDDTRYSVRITSGSGRDEKGNASVRIVVGR